MATRGFRPRKYADENLPAILENSALTSDNAYPVASFFSASQLAQMLGVTPTRVRQLAIENEVGQKVDKKNWIFSYEDFMVMVEVRHKMNKLIKRHHVPPVQAKTVRVVNELLQRSTNILALMIHDSSIAAFNRITRMHDGIRLKFRDIDERLSRLERK